MGGLRMTSHLTIRCIQEWPFWCFLHTAMAILVLLEQFLRKDCHIFGPQL